MERLQQSRGLESFLKEEEKRGGCLRPCVLATTRAKLRYLMSKSILTESIMDQLSQALDHVGRLSQKDQDSHCPSPCARCEKIIDTWLARTVSQRGRERSLGMAQAVLGLAGAFEFV